MTTAHGNEKNEVNAGSVSDYELNKIRIFETARGSIGVVRTQSGFFAMLNRCPHMGAPICVGTDVTHTTRTARAFDYSVDTGSLVVRCPWHRWEFSIDTGEAVGGITRGKLLRFPVSVVEDEVIVALAPARTR
ncbi:MAG: Rieske (2Fe-2S) protein [Flavobacteriaceae bacterium]